MKSDDRGPRDRAVAPQDSTAQVHDAPAAGSEAAEADEARWQGEVAMAIAARANLLVVGGEGQVARVIADIGARLAAPIAVWRAGTAFAPPPDDTLTLVLWDIAGLEGDDQQRLDEWLVATAGRVQVISTVRWSLWPKMQTAAFRAALYYRLNTVCVAIGE
jgi:hypothetical protein